MRGEQALQPIPFAVPVELDEHRLEPHRGPGVVTGTGHLDHLEVYIVAAVREQERGGRGESDAA